MQLYQRSHNPLDIQQQKLVFVSEKGSFFWMPLNIKELNLGTIQLFLFPWR